MPLFDSIVLTEVSGIGDLELAGGLHSLFEDGVSPLQEPPMESPRGDALDSVDGFLHEEYGEARDVMAMKTDSVDEEITFGFDLNFSISKQKNVGIMTDMSSSALNSDSGKYSFVTSMCCDL